MYNGTSVNALPITGFGALEGGLYFSDSKLLVIGLMLLSLWCLIMASRTLWKLRPVREE